MLLEVTAGDVEPIIPIRWRVVQRAIYTLLDEGKSPTQAAIATLMGIKRQQIWKFFQRHPGFLPWLDVQLKGENDHLFGLLARRMFMIGMQGSAQHAETFAKLATGAFVRGSSVPGANEGDPTGTGGVQVIQNFLIPRPETPQLAAPAAAVPPKNLADIPTLALR